MDYVTACLSYLRAHPSSVGVAVIALVGLYYLLNRKPKITREAEARIEALRRERADYYRALRPPR